MPKPAIEPERGLAALREWVAWFDGERDGGADDGFSPAPTPPRPVLADAVRFSLGRLEELVPGRSVELRVPPFGAIQCVAGPRHTRGTPPNVVEMSTNTWLALVTRRSTWADESAAGRIAASGSRSNLKETLETLQSDLRI